MASGRLGLAGRGHTSALGGLLAARLGAVPPLPPGSPVQSSTETSGTGGPRAGSSSHNPKCRRIFSITSVWWRIGRGCRLETAGCRPRVNDPFAALLARSLRSIACSLNRASRAVGERTGMLAPSRGGVPRRAPDLADNCRHLTSRSPARLQRSPRTVNMRSTLENTDHSGALSVLRER